MSDRVVPYPLTRKERVLLRRFKVMRMVFLEADQATRRAIGTNILSPLFTAHFNQLADALALKKGYKKYDRTCLCEGHELEQKVQLFEAGQAALLTKMNKKKLMRSVRFQRVARYVLCSRFEIDVWRGVYRFVLRNRGCYDPMLSFKELRRRFPLTEEELSATVELTKWITCSRRHNVVLIFPAHTEDVIRTLIHPRAS